MFKTLLCGCGHYKCLCCLGKIRISQNRTKGGKRKREMSCSKWLIVTAIVILTISSVAAEAESRVSLPECPEKCGDITIPYPFGVGNKCSYDPYFNITCNQTELPAAPFMSNMKILNISLLDAQIRLSTFVSRCCYDGSGQQLLDSVTSASVTLAKFTVNTTQNTFAATGCDAYGYLQATRYPDRDYTTGCLTSCLSPYSVDNWTCSGAGCCQTQIPNDVQYINVSAFSFHYYLSTSKEFTPCSSAFVVAKDAFNFSLANLTMSPDQMPKSLPVVYDWTIGNQTCTAAQANGTCLCCERCDCLNSEPEGYRCSCLPGYSGNPYLKQGCQDIDECGPGNSNNCKEPAKCVNNEGSYYCQCPKGFQGNGTIHDRCIPIQNSNQTIIKIILSVGGSIIFLLILGLLLHCYHGQRQMIKMRDTFFRQNGGLILYQRLSRREAPVDLVKIFTIEDLQKATNNYSEDNIIGRGGFGMVYKGTLPNNQVIAIKKSLKVDSGQVEQFINEVLVLSQVNNRNVVKLLGCCLETEVPLLVYEFISNGTLHDHLHDERKAFHLSWNIRLRIATEVAEVLAYLHTTISTPIIHRDIKSMNILLDENYVAKVSDFGASRLVPIEQDPVATVVQGTRGYLDPEYMQTGELNEKSDVYSFGVVLVELLTRRKALSFDKPEKERHLAMYFLLNLKEERILEITDEKIMSHGATEQLIEQLMEVATLARRCLEVKGEDRPNMKEVAMELERIRRKDMHPLLPTTTVESFDEEKISQQYLLSKAFEDSDAYDMGNTSITCNSQSGLLELVPSGGGR